MNRIKRIGVLTSGGDAPGMNAAIRAVARASLYHGISVCGIIKGYTGLIENNVIELTVENVSNIIQRGGTILKTARSHEFETPEGRARAYEVIQENEIDGLVVIGGDGSLTGARLLANEHNLPTVGIPATIDNDLAGTDLTIGYTTALNTIMDAVDKLRDTASSHERIFFVEVMGRESGFLALNGAIATGSEGALIPEDPTSTEALKKMIESGFRKTKSSSIILVTESGEREGQTLFIADDFKRRYPKFDIRVTILGHLQRGGIPCATDRIMGSRMGAAAVQALLDEQRNVMIGYDNDEIVYVPFVKATKKQKRIDPELIDLLHMLSI